MSTDTKPTLDAPTGLLEDLEALEAGAEPRPERVPWQPKSLGDVDWIMEMMGRLDAMMAENQTIADAACQRAIERLDRANGTLKRGRDYLESLAAAYSRPRRAEIIPGKTKSRVLANGTLAWRKTGGRLVRDEGPEAEAALLAWAKAQATLWPEVLRVKEEPAIAEIQKRCAPQPNLPHVIPPGMHWEEADEYGKLEVKPAGSALAKTTP